MEAEAFAEYVDVQINKDLAGEMEEEGYETTTREDKAGRENAYANFKGYINYIFDGRITSPNEIKTPGEQSQSVQGASDTIPGATSGQIRDRVKLLLLPGELQNDIDNRQLTQETALVLTRLKDLGDAEEMHEKMLELGRKEEYRKNGRNVDDLKDAVEDIIEER
ncbi:hypothetical protein C9439_00005, partial [archaeon SCG-AAA382B04]